MKISDAAIAANTPTGLAAVAGRQHVDWLCPLMVAAVALSASTSALALEFRAIDGTGNNLLMPSQGAADTRVIRFKYDADYPDGTGDVITTPGKPNPRDVSNAVIAQASSILNDRGLSDWAVHWGQFLTHDMTLIETSPANNVLSMGATGDFRIAVSDSNDPLGPNPIPFDRSNYDPATGNGDVEQTPRGPIPIPRWQINANTSYIDASNVYGSDPATANSLRTFADGKMATSNSGLLPPVEGGGRFLAGDVRANENVGLSATHALFVREHNRLADRIKSHDATLSDEEIYQWARKIVGAEVQAITYREYLPAVMGDFFPAAADCVYDPGVDASITTAFSTAAFRYGHSMQSPQIKLVDNAGAEIDAISLATASENPDFLSAAPSRVELILKGLATQTAQENDAYVVDDLRNIRFGPPGAGGTDLAAVDIQRGRDHGLLNSYNRLRTSYNLPPLGDFHELTSNTALQTALAATYGTVDNVDAWLGMISEDHFAGGSLGQLAAIILHSQFTRLRDGDRFFFTGDPDLETELVTSVINLDAITLGQLIELNTGLTNVQDNVFFVVAAVPEPTTPAMFSVGGAIAGLIVRTRRLVPYPLPPLADGDFLIRETTS